MNFDLTVTWAHILSLLSIAGTFLFFLWKIHHDFDNRINKITERTRSNFETMLNKIETNKTKLDDIEDHLTEKLEDIKEKLKEKDLGCNECRKEFVMLKAQHEVNHKDKK